MRVNIGKRWRRGIASCGREGLENIHKKAARTGLRVVEIGRRR